MSKNFLEEAYKERQRLQAEWEASELFAQMQMLDQVIAVYEGRGMQGRGKSPKPTGRQSSSNARPMSSQSMGATKEEEVIRLAMECIKARDGAANKRDIHQHIDLHGLHVSDAALSAYLSKSMMLAFEKERGWTLRKDPQAERPKSAEIMSLHGMGQERMSDAATEKELPRLNVQELWSSDKNF